MPGGIESLVPRHPIAFAFVGAMRDVLWRRAGTVPILGSVVRRTNQPGVHLVVHATETNEVLCVYPSASWALKWYHRIWHRWSDFHHVPGGGMDIGEGPEVALLRELEEELGVTDVDLNLIEWVEVEVDYGDLNNAVTFGLLRVPTRQDFRWGEPQCPWEFLKPPRWVSVGEASTHGSRALRQGLKSFGFE